MRQRMFSFCAVCPVRHIKKYVSAFFRKLNIFSIRIYRPIKDQLQMVSWRAKTICIINRIHKKGFLGFSHGKTVIRLLIVLFSPTEGRVILLQRALGKCTSIRDFQNMIKISCTLETSSVNVSHSMVCTVNYLFFEDALCWRGEFSVWVFPGWGHVSVGPHQHHVGRLVRLALVTCTHKY